VYPRINVTVCDVLHEDVGPTIARRAGGAGRAGAAAGAAALLLAAAVRALLALPASLHLPCRRRTCGHVYVCLCAHMHSCSTWHCTVLYCTELYCTVLHSTVLYCTEPHCTVLYCTEPHCTVLYCTAHHLQPLPDLSSWSYGGTTAISDTRVHIWQLLDRRGGKTNSYTFYVTPEGEPVRYSMLIIICLSVCPSVCLSAQLPKLCVLTQ
jgi:hypothetical protein